MSCPYVAKAILTRSEKTAQVIRLCMAIPRERDNDPTEMPAPSTCFSDKAYADCYHYRVMLQRGELPVEQPENPAEPIVVINPELEQGVL